MTSSFAVFNLPRGHLDPLFTLAGTKRAAPACQRASLSSGFSLYVLEAEEPSQRAGTCNILETYLVSLAKPPSKKLSNIFSDPGVGTERSPGDHQRCPSLSVLFIFADLRGEGVDNAPYFNLHFFEARNWRFPAPAGSCLAPERSQVATPSLPLKILQPTKASGLGQGPPAQSAWLPGPCVLCSTIMAHRPFSLMPWTLTLTSDALPSFPQNPGPLRAGPGPRVLEPCRAPLWDYSCVLYVPRALRP